jgi:hypothetical protein
MFATSFPKLSLKHFQPYYRIKPNDTAVGFKQTFTFFHEMVLIDLGLNISFYFQLTISPTIIKKMEPRPEL